MKMDMHETKEGLYINYQPGNGTRYDTYLLRCPDEDNLVVVSLPEFNTCFVVNKDATLTWGYVLEKMSRSGRRGNECDASAIAHLLSKILKISAKIHTGDDGRWTNEERWVGEHETE